MFTDFLNFIQSRRSLRHYTAQSIDPALIEKILTAGIWAPSAHNRQPWRFAVLSQADVKRRLADAMGMRLRQDLTADGVEPTMIQADVTRSYSRLTQASTLIVVCLSMVDMDVYNDPKRQENERVMAIQSVAMAGQNMLLMSHALGLGACWMCAPLFCPDVVIQTLEMPSDWIPQGIIALGYPSVEREKTREALQTKVIWR